MEDMVRKLMDGQGNRDLAIPTRKDRTEKQMTAEDVCGNTYDIKLDKWTGRNRTRACVINRLNSGVWRETEDANIGFTTKKIARNAQVSVLTGDTMLHNNVSFVRQEFTLYSEGVYKWLYTKLTTHGNPWPPGGGPREPNPPTRIHAGWPVDAEWPERPERPETPKRPGWPLEPQITIVRRDSADTTDSETGYQHQQFLTWNPDDSIRDRRWAMNTERINTETPSNHGFRCHEEGCFFKCASRENIKNHLTTAHDAHTNRSRQSKKKDTKNEFNEHQRGRRNTRSLEAFYEGQRGQRG